MPVKSADTKERILNTTTNLFSCYGVCATSVDDILSAVGLTKGAFYHYFKSKDHLCEEVLDRAIDEYHRLANDLQETGHENNLLQQWLQMLLEKQSSGQWLYYSLLVRLSIESTQLNASMQNKLKMFWLWCQTFFETLIQKTLPADPSSAVRPEELSRLYMAAHFGAVWLDRCAASSQDVTTVCETLLKLSCR
jgi:AcrR family transcriptional regulator